MSGMMANLVADSGCNKGQLSNVVETIMRSFRQHDEIEFKKLVDWQKMVKTKSANGCSASSSPTRRRNAREPRDYFFLNTKLHTIARPLPRNVVILRCEK